MKNKSSKIWNYYTIKTSTELNAICNICGEAVPRGGNTPHTFNTSNLNYHLKTKHKDEHEEFVKQEEEKKESWHERQKITNFFCTTKPLSKPEQDQITNSIVKMICLDMQPLNIVESKGFTSLISSLNPNYTMVSENI